MNKIDYSSLPNGKWRAVTWIMRECFTAEGATQQEAVEALVRHLEGIIPIYEHQIVYATDILNEIREVLNEVH